MNKLDVQGGPGIMPGALMSLLEHCNKDYLNFLCRTEDLISLLPSTMNTGQLKIIAVLKPQFFFLLILTLVMMTMDD